MHQTEQEGQLNKKKEPFEKEQTKEELSESGPLKEEQAEEELSEGEFLEGELFEEEQIVKEKSTIKRLVAVAVTEACILLMLSFAWYKYISNRTLSSESRDVMVPYYLYLLNDTAKDYFQLAIMNMHPGETKQIVVCVSNKDTNESGASYSVGRQSEFNYEMEFAYTRNIPLDYKLYELKPSTSQNAIETSDGKKWEKVLQEPLVQNVTASTKETTNNNIELNTAGVVNEGQYDIYSQDAAGSLLQLKTTVSGNQPVYEYDYYLIEITWKDNVNVTFSEYVKETDLVYVIVKAMQPRPEERQ